MKALALHLAVLAGLFVLGHVLPPYHHATVARIMVLAVYAMGFNLAFGYTGLLSLGHALLFAAGLYAAGLPAALMGWGAAPALLAGFVAGGAMAAAVGLLALRTAGVSFMIVTLMFAQAGYLTILWFTPVTRGEEGFVVPAEARRLGGLDFADDGTRYMAALALLSVAMLVKLALVRAPFGRVMVAMRENEARSRMLGFAPYRTKLIAFIVSGLFAGAAGAAWGLLFGYVGASFAATQYSILPLLYTLLGGAGTVLGPLLGTAAMVYLIDVASGLTDAYLLVVGVALVLLIIFAPKGLLGNLRERFWPWLP